MALGKGSQEKLRKASVAVVGLGALGGISAELLARAGVGNLLLIDRDVVELSNLQRQLLYSEGDIGKPKAEAALHRLKAINSGIEMEFSITDINHKNIEKVLKNCSLILDCTDNFSTRYLINDFSRKTKVPWIYAAAIEGKGALMLTTSSTPCFSCTFANAKSADTCDTVGVLNATTSAIGSLQANLAISFLLGKERGGQYLFSLDIISMELSRAKTRRNPKCQACKGQFDYLKGKKEPRSLSYQCSGTYQFFLDGINLHSLGKKWEKIGKVRKGKGFLFFNDISAFSNGRIIIRAKDGKEAKSILARYVGM